MEGKAVSEPLVTVIVPLYNVRAYLGRCLEAIVSQSYRRLEIILVDDGSSDGSGELADEWRSRDARIKVLHKSNSGPSDARNAALDIAAGELITFVDSDDVVHRDMVWHLLTALRETGAEASIGRMSVFEDERECDTSRSLQPHSHTAKTPEEALVAMLYQEERGFNHSPCGRLFRASLFNAGASPLRFPAGKIYEDLAIIIELMERCDRIATCDEVLYYYRHRSGSITTTFVPQRSDVLDVLERFERLSSGDERHRYLLRPVRARLLSASFNMLRLVPRGDSRYDALVERSWRHIVRLRGECLSDGHMRLRNKAAVALSYSGRKITQRILSYF